MWDNINSLSLSLSHPRHQVPFGVHTGRGSAGQVATQGSPAVVAGRGLHSGAQQQQQQGGASTRTPLRH